MSIADKEGLLYELTLDSLIARLKSEDVSAADINAARQMMKENGIQGGKAMEDKEAQVALAFPVFKRPEEEGYGSNEDIA